MRKAVLAGTTVLICVTTTFGTADPAALAAGGQRAGYQVCQSSTHRALAAKMSSDILKAVADRRGETPVVAVRADDPALDMSCSLHGRRHFDSASVIKTIILAALERKKHAEHGWLTRRERALARLMITESDNNAATALWNDVGMRQLQRFLDLAGMGRTKLNVAWGLTRITADDETILLDHLLLPNPVLTLKARNYELRLMAQVIPSQRWGVTAGAPTSYTAHVKNGWAPLPDISSPWWINSTGCFTRGGKYYTMVVLTEGNADMTIGVQTIEHVAHRINRDLNPGAKAVVPYSKPSPSWARPDEPVPPVPGRS
jgi:beta-lactamase family protein